MKDQRPTTVLVANDGGHITQLLSLSERLPVAGGAPELWFTVQTPQTTSLLDGREVVWLHPSHPRDLRSAARNAALAWDALKHRTVGLAVSTGSSLALSVLPITAVKGVNTVYIESATRVLRPSLTGTVLRWWPRVTTCTQQRSWHRRGWVYAGSIFDGYAVSRRERSAPVKNVLVTLGTSRAYGFRRLLVRLLQELPPDVTVTWQTGSTDVSGLDIAGVDRVDAATLRRWISEADVVVAHAGTGSALACLQVGKVPLLVPREVPFGEHIDDHQMEIARDLASRGLAVTRSVEEVNWDACLEAASLEVRRTVPPPLAW